MLIRKLEIEKPSLEQIHASVDASQNVHPHAEDQQDINNWVDRTLRYQNCPKMSGGAAGGGVVEEGGGIEGGQIVGQLAQGRAGGEGPRVLGLGGSG